MSYLDKLPEELEDYIYKLVHGFYQHDINKFIKNALAPIEHLFNNHVFSDPAWCWARDIDDRIHEIITKAVDKKVKIKLMRK